MDAKAGKKAADTLSRQQKRFVEEYLVDCNGVQAAIRAGYAPKSAHVSASRLLSIDKVQAAITAGAEKRSQRTGITADSVLKAVHEIAEEARAAEKYGDALRGYELVGKHLRMWTDKTEISGELPVPTFNFSFVTPDASRDG